MDEANEKFKRDRNGFITLEPIFSKLWKRTSYTAPFDEVSDNITEYDMRHSNTSILRQTKKLKSSTLDAIEELPGHERKVMIGKIERDQVELKGVIAKEVKMAKLQLFKVNGIRDEDILSIKNDAVFIIGRKLKQTTFGAIEFRKKNSYIHYISMEGMELYFDGLNQHVDIKGIGDSILAFDDHKNGMLSFLATVMRMRSNGQRDQLRKYLINFTEQYKERKLPLCYYRELSNVNAYRTTIDTGRYTLCLDQVDDSYRDELSIVYNYNRFVLPMIQRYL